MGRLLASIGTLLVFGILTSGSLLAASTTQLDLTSEPKGILPQATLDKLWDAYKTAKECFAHPNYDPGVDHSVATLPISRFQETEWHSPFTSIRGAASCTETAGSLYAPAPIPKVTLDEVYGNRNQPVDVAEEWFRRLTTYIRLTNDPLARKLVKDALLDWAKNNSLGAGIRVSWGAKPVDYQMVTAIMAVLTATAEVADDLTPDDRAIIGPWLNGLVKASSESRWKDREDDHVFLSAYMRLVWGLVVGDDAAVQDVIFTYKLAIHDMRPDGSWPIDSQRGVAGIHYNAKSTGDIVLIAAALKSARNIDLFSYSVDGRSVHTAVDFVVRSIKDPPGVNREYAISCPSGGDTLGGSMDNPNLYFVDGVAGGYLSVYASLFPDRDAAAFIREHFAGSTANTANEDEQAGGAPACEYAEAGGTVNLPALQPPPPLPTLPKPQYVVTSQEDLEHTTDHSNFVDVELISAIAGNKKGQDNLDYNITGDFSYQANTFLDLKMALNDPLGKTVPKALAACGAETKVYDDGQVRVIIDFDVQGDNFVARNAACIIKALPVKQAFLANFLFTSFRDVAIGIVSSDQVSSLHNDALQIFMKRVAFGEIKIGM